MPEGTQYTGGFVNGRCYARKALEDGPPFYYNGDFHFQAHQVGWIVAGTLAFISTLVSIWLINKHLQWYTNPGEQRYIVRLLFMVPIYALISFGSYLFWNHSTPLILIRDCYESVVLTSFFYLLLTYLSPNTDEQKETFRVNGLSHENDRQRKRKGLKPQKWVFPLGSVKSRPADGLYFLQIMKWAILQYCVVRPVTTLAAVILDYVGLYCEVSLSPGWGHLYITAIVSLSVTIAMYFLIQLYVVVSQQLKPRQPLLKLFSVKAVVFLTFWQATALSIFVTLGLVKDTKYMTAENITIGIGAILECLEMSIFAFLHIKCFTYKVYVPDSSAIEGSLRVHRTPRLKSLVHAMNPMETLRELWAGVIYMVQRWRGKETDKQARRMAAHQGVFGHSRTRIMNDSSAQSESLIRGGREKKRGKKGPGPLDDVGSGRLDEVLVDVEREVYLNSERQWLAAGHVHDYPLGAITREKSESFEDQVVRELHRKGYTLREASKHSKGRSISRDVTAGQGHVRRGSHCRSWWQAIYYRVSQSGEEDEHEKHLSHYPKRKSASLQSESAQVLPLVQETPMGRTVHPYEDPPTPLTLDAHHSGQFTNNGRNTPCNAPLRTSLSASGFTQQSPEPMKLSANPQVQLGRSDSLLDRVFTYLETDAYAMNTDLDHETDSQPSRPSSLWRAGSANVVPRHNGERSSITKANTPDGVYLQPVTPVRESVVGVDGIPTQDEEPPAQPKRSHIREMAGHSLSTPHSPPLQPPSPVVGDLPIRDDPPANPLELLHPFGTHPSAPIPFSHLPPPKHDSKRRILETIAGTGLRLDPARPRPATRKKALLREFPEPVYYPPLNMGPARFTPPRNKLSIPTPLAQPLPRGSGSLKRNKMNSLQPPEQCNFARGRPYREPPNRPRRCSQPVPGSRHTLDLEYTHLPTHLRTSQLLPTLRDTIYPNTSPSSSPHQLSKRLTSPPLSAPPLSRPNRSDATHRKSQSPGSRSTPSANFSEDLMSSSSLDSSNFTRYPAPGSHPGTGLPPRNGRTRAPPSPGARTFVNTHMLPPPTNSPRSDVEEWASAVSSFSPSVRAK